MKKWWTLLALSFGLGLGLGAAWWYLPRWIGQEIDARLAEAGMQTRSRVSDFGHRGMLLDIEVLVPRKITIPTLSLSWKLQKFWREIPFEVLFAATPNSKSQTLVVLESLNLQSPRLHLSGIYQDGAVRFDRIEAGAEAEIFGPQKSISPVKLKFEVGPAPSDGPLVIAASSEWRWQLQVPAQSFAALGYPQLSLRTPLQWEGSYRRLDRHELRVEASSSIDRWEWKLGPDDTVRVGLSQLEFESFYGTGFGPFKLRAKVNANWRAFAPTGSLDIAGASLAQLEASFRGETRSRIFKHDKFQFGVGRIVHTLSASGSRERIQSLRLQLKGSLDRMIYDNTPIEEVEFSTRIRCTGLRPAAVGLEALREGCALDSSPLKASVGRIGTKQPLRGIAIELHRAKKDYEGSLQAQWQGSPVKSEIFEVAEDFSKLKLSVKASKLSLFEVLNALDNPKLSGKGELAAAVLLDWELASGLRIWPATFESVGKGWVRYADPALLDMEGAIDTLGRFQELMARGQQALVLKALEDFHYDSLRAELWRDPKLKMRMELHLKGGNPSLAKSQPFEINIPIEGDLESLLLNSVFKDFSRRLPKTPN